MLSIAEEYLCLIMKNIKFTRISGITSSFMIDIYWWYYIVT